MRIEMTAEKTTDIMTARRANNMTFFTEVLIFISSIGTETSERIFQP